MRNPIIAAIAATLIVSFAGAAEAQQRARVGGALVGAGAGAVVGGPVGAVVGAGAGYVTGPAVSRAVTPRRTYKARYRRAR